MAEKVKLDLVRLSDYGVRSYDDDKLEELTGSVRKWGLVVPVKLRPVGDGYEIVYGRRRVEACRRAGLKEVECIVEDLDDTSAQVQALVENVQREDMGSLDVARGLRAILDVTGWSLRRLAREGVMPLSSASVTLALLEEAPEVQKLVGEGSVTVSHVTEARSAGTTVRERVQLLNKAASERLTRKQTRRLARGFKRAEDDHERQAILDTAYNDSMFDRLVKVRTDLHREHEKRERKKRQEEDREVREYLDVVRTYAAAVQEAVGVAEWGKFSPEAGRFCKRWHDDIRDRLETLDVALGMAVQGGETGKKSG